MISNSNLAASFPSLLAPTGSFASISLPTLAKSGDTASSAGLGVSTASAPLISAPATRQSTEFQAAIAPPTRPANPAIAPPKTGGADNALAGTSASMSSPMEILAYIAALKLQMASSQGNGPSGSKDEALKMMGKSAAA